MDITGIAKSHHADIPKPSSKKEWKLSDSLREQIAGYAREDAAQGVYMGNKFLALRKSEVAKVAPHKAALMGKVRNDIGRKQAGIPSVGADRVVKRSEWIFLLQREIPHVLSV